MNQMGITSVKNSTATDSLRIASQAANAVLDGFDSFHTEFKNITRRAKTRFEDQDWHGAQLDALDRLELYKKVVDRIVAEIQAVLQANCKDPAVWAEMKAIYAGLIDPRADYELAETFFNSITRRIFTTVGVDPGIEFVGTDFEAPETHPLERAKRPLFKTYYLAKPQGKSVTDLVWEILAGYPFRGGYEEIERDAFLVAGEIQAHLPDGWGTSAQDRIEILHPVFYRGHSAFLIGRVWGAATITEASGRKVIPLAICLLNTPGGVVPDAVLMDEDEVSIVFSFTRSYFHVEVERPHEVIEFLKSIMPRKRIAELYISIGYNKHGKTELYRDLLRHLASSEDKFEIARGEKGMVMSVFSMPSYDMVFKIIKDKVDPPKTTTRKEVMERYDLVFKHDRAGRLVDAQEFEHLSFDRARFARDLLEELLTLAPSQVSVEAGCVVVRHLYIERRLTPLNLYIKEVDEQAARAVVIDYGQSIKDLAATNIFPGDVLLKNFGVTRHGRVVFYDYDELCLLTECKFRKLPQARNFDDEFSAEPWFYVGPLDIFPEEFRTFLGLLEPLRSIFIAEHADLFEAGFWRKMQARHRAGEVVDIYPYPESKHLRRENAS